MARAYFLRANANRPFASSDSHPFGNQLCTVNKRLFKDAAVLQLFDSELSCVLFHKLDRRCTRVLLLTETLSVGLTGDLHEKVAGAPVEAVYSAWESHCLQ